MLLRNASFRLSMLFTGILIITLVSVSRPQDKTLYQRLGGYDAIAAVVNDFFTNLVNDDSLSVYFKGHSDKSKVEIKQHIVDFVCFISEGPCAYNGKDMKTSHTGLGINEEQWNKTVELLKNTLNKFNVPEQEQNDLLHAVASLKNDIVE